MQIRQIIKELGSETLKTLSLKDIAKGAAFNQATFVEFCDAFAANNSLISLDFTGFELGVNIEGLESFFDALKQNRGLKQLNFSGIKSVAKYMTDLSKALSEPDGNTALLTLDLSNCGITDSQIENLTFLKYNHTLQSLNLENNNLTASGAALIARQLKHYKRKSDLYSAKVVAQIKDFPLVSEEPAKNEKLHELKLGHIQDKPDSSYDAFTIQAGIHSALEFNKRKPSQTSDSGSEKKPDEKIEKADKVEPDFSIEENVGIILMSKEPTEATINSIPTTSNIIYIFVRDEQKNLGLFYVNKELEECIKIKLSEEKLDSLYEKMKPAEKARTLTSDEAKEFFSVLKPKIEKASTTETPSAEKKEGIITSADKKKEAIRQPQEIPLTFLNKTKSTFKPVYSDSKPPRTSLAPAHIKKIMFKFAGGTTTLGLIAIAILLGIGLMASGPAGWIMAASIIGGCLAAGLIIGAITGAITVPKTFSTKPKHEFLTTNNASMTQTLLSAPKTQPSTQPKEEVREKTFIVLSDSESSSEEPSLRGQITLLTY